MTKISFDQNGDEAFVGDGYGNKRVVVVDSDTGEFLRSWGAYGNRPDDADLGSFDPDGPPAQQFRGPVHCAEPSNDGLVYVCDRTANRLQVFQQDGTFVEEVFIEPRTLGAGLHLGDCLLARRRPALHVPGRRPEPEDPRDGPGEPRSAVQPSVMVAAQPGQFYGVHSIETDSQGNLYTTETWEGKRLQKFVYRGMGRVERGSDQGVLWPADQ